MKTRILKWSGVAVSVAVISYLVSQFDMGAALHALAMADLVWLLPAAALYMAIFGLRGLRWTVLLRNVKPIGVGTATEVFIVGAMANNVMPARLGDVARAFVLSRRARIGATTTFANVLLERVIDGLTVVGLLAAVLFFAPPGAGWVRSVGAAMTALFVVAIAGAFALVWAEAQALALASWFMRPLPEGLSTKIAARLKMLVGGLGVLRQPGPTAGVLALSVAIWLLEVGVYALAQKAFGLTIPPEGLICVMAILTLGLTAPSAPGFVGVFEGLIIAAVGLYGVGEPLAPAFAIAMHLIHYVPVTLLGLGFAWRSGLRIRELDVAAEDGETAGDALDLSPGGA